MPPKPDKTRSLSVKPPNKLLYALLSRATLRYYKKRCGVSIDSTAVSEIKPPFAVICNHPSFYDWIFLAAAVKPWRVNVVMTRYYFYTRPLAPLLKALGAIPKDLFAPDTQTVREILKVIKSGGCIGIFPEGRLSPAGELENISPSTGRLLKKLGVPVINVHIEGSYLARPKYNHSIRRGEVKVKATPLFTPDDLASMSEAEIQEKTEKALYYNEFAAQKTNGTVFESDRLAEGLQNVLYLCPKCRQTFLTKTEGNRIFCLSCGNEGRFDNRFNLKPYAGASVVPSDIAEWYKLQKKHERTKIEADPDYTISDAVVLKMPLCGRETFTEVGRGTAVLNKNGLSYDGTRDGEPWSLFVPLDMLPVLPYGANCDFELTYHGEFFYFEPSRLRECVRWSVAAEQLYEVYCKGEKK